MDDQPVCGVSARQACVSLLRNVESETMGLAYAILCSSQLVGCSLLPCLRKLRTFLWLPELQLGKVFVIRGLRDAVEKGYMDHSLSTTFVRAGFA